MSKFRFYAFQVDTLAKIVRERPAPLNMTKNQARAASPVKLACKALEVSGLVAMGSEVILTCVENAWLSGNKETYFIESKELIEKLHDAKYVANKFKPPLGYRMIIPPKGTFIKGVEIPPCLVTTTTFDMRKEASDLLNKHLDKPISYSKQITAPEEALAIFFNTGSKDNRLHFFVNIPIKRIGEVMSATTVEEFAGVVGNLSTQDGFFKLDKKETYTQWILTRTIIGLFIYEKAYPNSIKKGLHIHSNAPEGTLSHKVIGEPTFMAKRPQGENKAIHLRSAHFRVLTDERYYKGEHKDKEIGSRVVYIQETIVGTKKEPVDAYTVTEEP